DHVPVADVVKHFIAKLFEDEVETVYDSLLVGLRINRPNLHVLAINLHAGDNGDICEVDDKVLRPSLQKIKDSGKLMYGPYSADSFFGSNNYKNFDAVIASYHDQGFIPFKTITFGEGVNFTAGLNKVRTSPDHGTAYEIA